MHSIPFSFPGVRGVKCLFSTRLAGDMALRNDPAPRAEATRNRERFMATAGFRLWAETFQVHADALIEAEGGEGVGGGAPRDADGMYTLRRGVGLTIRTADCQPILIAREDGGAAAALHVGWRGNALNFPGTAVERLCRHFDCAPRNLLAVRGPSLGPAAAEFINFSKEWPERFRPWFNEADKTVNLWRLTRHQLEEAGLEAGRIFSLDMCTRDMGDTFFSYRRGESGRHVNAIWLE